MDTVKMLILKLYIGRIKTPIKKWQCNLLVFIGDIKHDTCVFIRFITSLYLEFRNIIILNF